MQAAHEALFPDDPLVGDVFAVSGDRLVCRPLHGLQHSVSLKAARCNLRQYLRSPSSAALRGFRLNGRAFTRGPLRLLPAATSGSAPRSSSTAGGSPDGSRGTRPALFRALVALGPTDARSFGNTVSQAAHVGPSNIKRAAREAFSKAVSLDPLRFTVSSRVLSAQETRLMWLRSPARASTGLPSRP